MAGIQKPDEGVGYTQGVIMDEYVLELEGENERLRKTVSERDDEIKKLKAKLKAVRAELKSRTPKPKTKIEVEDNGIASWSWKLQEKLRELKDE